MVLETFMHQQIADKHGSAQGLCVWVTCNGHMPAQLGSSLLLLLLLLLPAEGATAVVYAAEDLLTGRPVALKVGAAVGACLPVQQAAPLQYSLSSTAPRWGGGETGGTLAPAFEHVFALYTCDMMCGDR
jgi:hypothetical protein